ncbi:hypothetical protein CONLIGDRAFT_636792 [Coniochaeta ligniaria NRRL 30616]|uniref:Uncharacterized protein n=1 Tax=Coniochaeta ligniaria NRRL 30616 TaxID=1408157 RepID=A0A1J7IB27_9PEZI|nr:hypothetical protein CONLIGDRAFT_636792 [Coniochaeta ligniaria NRRL 30616]
MRPFPRRSSTSRNANPPPNSRPSQKQGPRPNPQSPPSTTSPRPDDGGTGKQMNQTFAITMMASPVNPLPFMLPIPIGVAMLLGPSANKRP